MTISVSSVLKKFYIVICFTSKCFYLGKEISIHLPLLLFIYNVTYRKAGISLMMNEKKKLNKMYSFSYKIK